MEIFNLILCVAAICLTGLSILVIVIRAFTSSSDESGEGTATATEGGTVDGTPAEDALIARQPLQLNNPDCEKIVKTGVIWRRATIATQDDNILYFASSYNISSSSISDLNLLIYTTLYGLGEQASPGDYLILNCEGTFNNVSLSANNAVKSFISLDGSGTLQEGLSGITLQPGYVYKITYLGTVAGNGTVGIQLAAADNANDTSTADA